MGSKKILIRIIGLALSLSLVFSGQAGTFHVFAEDMTVENPDSRMKITKVRWQTWENS